MKEPLHWPVQSPHDPTASGAPYNYGRWPGNEGCPLIDRERLKTVPRRMRELKPFPGDRRRRDPLGLEE